MTQTVIIRGDAQRALAKSLVDRSPPNAVITFKEETRTNEQSMKMWSMLSDIARAKPDGRCHPAETWKALAMHACGWAVQFENGLNGQPFPVGYRSSRMTKAQMAELIEFLYSYGAEKSVRWSEPMERAA